MTDQPEEENSARDDIRQRMTDDDRAQWDAIQEWKAAQVTLIVLESSLSASVRTCSPL